MKGLTKNKNVLKMICFNFDMIMGVRLGKIKTSQRGFRCLTLEED